jgi:YD repeat-containing protein
VPGNCRFCQTQLAYTFADLGMSPLSNSFLSSEQLAKNEPFYPLHAYVCDKCFLVQLEEYEQAEDIFSDYVYFSSYSQSWLEHASHYADMMVERFSYDSSHQIIEIASNDGYLLQYFKKKNIPVLGIEPAANVAAVAIEKGIDTQIKFFGEKTASELRADSISGDLILGNNVLAHVPDINDFVGGLKIALADKGIITMEFPHLLNLIDQHQFDTIYHEHFSYLSLLTVEQIFNKHKLKIFDVEQLTTHGGSLRIFCCHDNNESQKISSNVVRVRQLELDSALDKLDTYLDFTNKVEQTKRSLLEFFDKAKKENKSVAGYGAPAKGNTLLNFCDVKTDSIDYTVDRSPHKQGLFLPGTHIPVYPVEHLKQTKPDYILVLPWNLYDEISQQLEFTRSWGCKLVVPIPEIQIL